MLEILTLLLPVGLSLAQIKVSVFGLPVYTLEGAALLFCLALLWRWFRSGFLWEWSVDQTLLIGSSLFLVGATFSTLLSHPTPTSLGQLKSWVLFPVATFLVLSLTSKSFKLFLKSREGLLLATLIGLSPTVFLAFSGYWQGYLTYDNRLAFPESSPNFLAFLTLLGIFLAIYQLLQSKELWQRLTLSLFLMVAMFVLWQTRSYNVFLASIFTSITLSTLVFVQKNQMLYRKLFFMGVTLFCILGGFFWLEQGTEKWQSLVSFDERSSLQSRLMIWQSAGMILKDHWLVGIGVGNFQTVYLEYQKYFPPYLEWAVPQPHNIWLAVWLETGVLGLGGFLLVIIRVFGLLWCQYRKTSSKESLLYGAFFLTFLCYGLFDTPYFRNDLSFLFWWFVWLTAQSTRNDTMEGV